MPYDDPDPSDPNMLIGMEVPGDENSAIEMAYVFAEEFARLGFSEERVLSLFRQPYYAGSHRALRLLGEDKIKAIIRETFALWGKFPIVVEDAPEKKLWDVPLDSLRSAGKTRPRAQQTGGDHESSL
jgi:hypothetical protein